MFGRKKIATLELELKKLSEKEWKLNVDYSKACSELAKTTRELEELRGKVAPKVDMPPWEAGKGMLATGVFSDEQGALVGVHPDILKEFQRLYDYLGIRLEHTPSSLKLVPKHRAGKKAHRRSPAEAARDVA